MMGKRWVALLTAAALITLTGFSLQGEAAPQADPVAQLNAKVDRALEMLGSMVGEGAEDAGQH